MRDVVLQQNHEATPDGVELLLLLRRHRPHPIRPAHTDIRQSADALQVVAASARSRAANLRSRGNGGPSNGTSGAETKRPRLTSWDEDVSKEPKMKRRLIDSDV